MNTATLYQPRSPTWCPGCGNHGIWGALKTAIKRLRWGLDEYVIVYGIGCSGNMNDFIKSHGFHSLHGRAIPNAEGIKIANHDLNTICVVGDGDCYGEGGNHFIHAMRGNTDICVVVHDNRVYGLTTGQTSPTSPKGYKSKSTPLGVIEYPLNPLALGIIQGATFVAQGYAGDVLHLTDLLVKALTHKGFTLVNVLQPCVTFNKVITYDYYRKRVYKLEEENYSSNDQKQALQRVIGSQERIPIGVLYQTERPTYQDQEPVLAKSSLVKQPLKPPIEYLALVEEFLEIEHEQFHPAG